MLLVRPRLDHGCARARLTAAPNLEFCAVAGAPLVDPIPSTKVSARLSFAAASHVFGITLEGESRLQVFVRDNNVDQALRILKKKMQREGVFREMKRRRFYEKPSAKATREKGEAVRRARKLARKKAVREGLIAAPPKKKIEAGRRGAAPRGGAAPSARSG